ncbi:bestrophin-like domain [Roseateles sp. P5_D6]
MPLIAYDLPNWLLGLTLVLAWMLIALAAQTFIPRRWREQATEIDRNVMLASLGVIATINSLLLAFSAVSVWESFGAAEQAVQREATAIAQLGRTLALYEGAPARIARERLRAYGRSVVTKEWPAMLEDRPSATTLDAFDALFYALATLRPSNPADTVLLDQAWTQANELVSHRRARLQASKGKVPATLWAVVLAGSVLTLIPMAVPPVSTSSRGALLMLAVALGLIFHFVAAMDRPFLGAERVTPEAIEDALEKMQRFAPRLPAPS